jgi:hypothetical protein
MVPYDSDRGTYNNGNKYFFYLNRDYLRMKLSIAEKICKDKNYVEIRRFFEEGDNLSLNRIIGISCRDGLLEILMQKHG